MQSIYHEYAQNKIESFVECISRLQGQIASQFEIIYSHLR